MVQSDQSIIFLEVDDRFLLMPYGGNTVLKTSDDVLHAGKGREGVRLTTAWSSRYATTALSISAGHFEYHQI